MEEKEEKILTKPMCIFICIFLIISMIYTSYFIFRYDICYVTEDSIQYLNLSDGEKVICAFIPFQFNVHTFYLVTSVPRFPFIIIEEINVGYEGSNYSRFYGNTYENRLDYILHIYNALSLVAFIALKRHMKRI